MRDLKRIKHKSNTEKIEYAKTGKLVKKYIKIDIYDFKKKT